MSSVVGSVLDSGSGSGFVVVVVRGAEEEVLKGFPALANGLLLPEKGEPPVVENGLTEPEGAPIVFAPKSVSPRLDGGCGLGFSSCGFAFSSFFLSFVVAVSVALPGAIRTLRNARMLPSLRRQLLRRHEKTYSRRSWPGKRSGNSPSNWSSRTMMSLHILHRTSAADGGLLSSSHSYNVKV